MDIINNTPWDSQELAAFLTPLLEGSSVTKVVVDNHQPLPGTRRAEQKLCAVSTPYHYGKGNPPPVEVRVELLTPKRAKGRMTTLDRLAYSADLQPHEVPIPQAVIEDVTHALKYLRNHPTEEHYQRRKHLVGRSEGRHNKACDCARTVASVPVIRGDTRAKTRPPVTARQLRRKLYYLDGEISGYETALIEAREKRERLLTRIENAEKREAKAASS